MKKPKLSVKEKFRIFKGIILILLILLACAIKYAYDKIQENQRTVETSYNMAFNELVGYVQNIENYLAKATISSSSEHGAETLTEVCRQSDMAVAYLSQLPLTTEELTKTAKFLNQVGEYSYSLSRKSIYNEDLTQEELDNLETLHDYSLTLKDSLNNMSEGLNSGAISWSDITKTKNLQYAQQVDNVDSISFTDIDNNFNEFAGLIYDGAFSEHIDKIEKKGLTGDNVNEDEAKRIAKKFIGEDKVADITLNAVLEEANIPVYDFTVKIKDAQETANISISKKGGKVILMNYPRTVEKSKISNEEANKIGKEFLESKGFPNMKETYYQLESNVITINYAYNQNNIVIYSDLIKLKIALDNGEIVGIETTGYINSHTERTDTKPTISIEEAKEKLNKKLNIESEGLAIIPTEWKTEILCYEFKGKVEETEFLVYINAKNGREENILVIIETPGGTLTM